MTYLEALQKRQAEVRKREEAERRKEQRQNVLAGTAIAGGVITGIALYKKGAFNKVVAPLKSKLGDTTEELAAGARAVKNLSARKGIGSVLGDELETEIKKNLTDVYLKRMQPLHAKPSEFEYNLAQLTNLKQNAFKSYTTSVRREYSMKFMRHVQESGATTIDKDMVDAIEKAMREDTRWTKYRANQTDAVMKYLRKHGIEVDTGKAQFIAAGFEYSRFDTLKKHIPREEYDALRKQMAEHVSGLNEKFDQAFVDMFVKKPVAKSSVHQITVQEALDRGLITKAPEINQNAPLDVLTKRMVKAHPELANAPIDTNILTDAAGAIYDTRSWSQAVDNVLTGLMENTQIPFVGFNPLKVFHYDIQQNIKQAPNMLIFKAGTKQPGLTNSIEALQNDIAMVGGKAYDITTGDLVSKDIQLISARYGMPARALPAMAGMTSKDYADNAILTELQKIFDIGRQETESEIAKDLRQLKKGKDPLWIRNMYKAYQAGELPTETVETFFNQFQKLAGNNVTALSDAQLDEVFAWLKQKSTPQDILEALAIPDIADISDLYMQNPSDVIEAARKIVNSADDSSYAVVRLKEYLNEYSQDPEVFLKSKVSVNKAEQVFLGIKSEQHTVVSKIDLVQRTIEEEMIYRLQSRGGMDVWNITDGLSPKTVKALRDIDMLAEINEMQWTKYTNPDIIDQQITSKFLDLLSPENPTPRSKHWQNFVTANTPWFGSPSPPPPHFYGEGVEYAAIHKTRNPIESINETIKNGGNVVDAIDAFVRDTIGQVGFGFGSRAGRKHMDEVTPLTLYAYNTFFRINELMSRVGIGMSNDSLGSSQDIFKNFMLKRILYPALAIGGLAYLNYEIGNITDRKPSDALLDTYANMTIGTAKLRDALGINKLLDDLNAQFPGLNLITEESPIAMVARGLTFGLLGSSKTAEELEAEYTYKDVPVRKGRYWPLGSTPWYGSKVEFYAPNFYRQIRSHYKYTDVLYGSEAEYWAHSPFPNPRNLGGLIPLTDPNHYAKKHKEDRPYPTYGGYEQLRNIPVVGPILFKASTLLNPIHTRSDLSKVHREYLTAINEAITDKARDFRKGSYIYFSPSGEPTIVGTDMLEGNTAAGGAVSSSASSSGIGYQSISGGKLSQFTFVPQSGGNNVTYVAGRPGAIYNGKVVRGRINGKEQARRMLTNINEEYTKEALTSEKPLSGIAAIRNNADYMESIIDIGNVGKLTYQLQEMYYSTTELTGLYGFLTTTIFGQPEHKGTTLGYAGDMTSAGRAFWDLRLGGSAQTPYTEDFSEFLRRLIPKPLGSNSYNPYVNKMPGWMPGCFVAGTPVLTYKGFIPIEKISAGDYVVTHTGAYRRVTDTSSRTYDGTLRTISIDGVGTLICTIDHPFLVYRDDKLIFVPAKDLSVQDTVAEIIPQCNNKDELLLSFGGDLEGITLDYAAGYVCGLYVMTGTMPDCKYLDTVLYRIQSTSVQFARWLDTLVGSKRNSLCRLFQMPTNFRHGVISAIAEYGDYNISLTVPNPPDGLVQMLATCGIYADMYDGNVIIPPEGVRHLRIISQNVIPASAGSYKQDATIIGNRYRLRHIISISDSYDVTTVYNLTVVTDKTYNVYGIACHNSDYFIDFKHGDPYTKVPLGEARLPGSGYEALNKLHPDKYFGEYGAVDRLKILGNVAPYSTEYSFYKKVVSLMNQAGLLTPEEKEIVKNTTKEVQEVKKEFDIYPYKYKHADIEKKEVTVKYVINNNLFVTKEYPLTPIRLAGIKAPTSANDATAQQISEYIKEYVYPGAKITIGVAQDAINRNNQDALNSMKAAVYIDNFGHTLQQKLVQQFRDIKIKDQSTTPADVAALYTPTDITIGKLWESITHSDNPISTKFAPIRSALEMYERRDIYGKPFQSWSRPISDYIIPTAQAVSRHNPIVSTLVGAGIGALFGKGKARLITAAVGGVIGGAGGVIRVAGETLTGEKYIPKRVKKEREINEYFDILSYIKYTALYNRQADMARRYERNDVREDMENAKKIGRMNKGKLKRLQEQLAVLKMRQTDPLVYEDKIKEQIDEIQQRINYIKQAPYQRVGMKRYGRYATQALLYKEAAESTLYGFDPENIDYTEIYRALPKKERAYFQRFATAPPKERVRILQLLPENEHRVYQAVWGMKTDKPLDLKEYFKTHTLPGPEWEGWRPDVSLEAVKVKVMKQEGVDLKNAGYWDEQINSIRNAPDLPNITHKPSMFIDTKKLEQVLRGAGLSDVELKYAIGPATDADTIAVNIDTKLGQKENFVRFVNDRGI